MFEKRKYRAAAGLKEVGGEPVVRGRVEMTEAKALYHLALGRITLPTLKRKAAVSSDTEEETASGTGG
ncbi:hypothetical protein [uncultured Cohaesibacter sp.]|uniref:hypothetical protein n=1 Tax=uncultured Cohaesibacter sp. TaxID=1002546 RepID=UPI0029C830C2|nr:hypothetical protein [uncultured Cohaesibacter sp.]